MPQKTEFWGWKDPGVRVACSGNGHSRRLASPAQMAFADSVFYYWSDKEWDSCDRFREAATAVLNKQAAPDLLEWGASDTQVSFSPGSPSTLGPM